MPAATSGPQMNKNNGPRGRGCVHLRRTFSEHDVSTGCQDRRAWFQQWQSWPQSCPPQLLGRKERPGRSSRSFSICVHLRSLRAHNAFRFLPDVVTDRGRGVAHRSDVYYACVASTPLPAPSGVLPASLRIRSSRCSTHTDRTDDSNMYPSCTMRRSAWTPLRKWHS
jgi:hypothetical protein